jgi:hypothetical protein
VLLELNMPVAQIALLSNTDIFGDAACANNPEPKAATGCHLNGRLFVSADFVRQRRFDVLELSFRGKLVMDRRTVMCSFILRQSSDVDRRKEGRRRRKSLVPAC